MKDSDNMKKFTPLEQGVLEGVTYFEVACNFKEISSYVPQTKWGDILWLLCFLLLLLFLLFFFSRLERVQHFSRKLLDGFWWNLYQHVRLSL